MDPINVTTLGLPGVAWLWALTLLAFGVFAWRIRKLVALLRQGRYEDRFDHLPRRLLHVLKHVLLQPRLFNERSIGLPHFLIFWGFVLYAACFNWSLLRGLFPFLGGLGLPFPDELHLIGLFLEVFAVLVLISLAVALARRLFYPPPHLHLSFDANLILGLIAMLMFSTLFGSVFRVIGWSYGGFTPWAPLGSLLAGAFSETNDVTGQKLAVGMWWLHMIMVLFFLVYLPFSKHLHLLASPFNVFFSHRRHPPTGRLGGARRPGRHDGRRLQVAGADLETVAQRFFLRRMRTMRPGLPGHRLRLPARAPADHPEDQESPGAIGPQRGLAAAAPSSSAT